MPSICYDDDSANEKNHWGNRRNCIDAAPFSLWLVTSFFFLRRAHAPSSSISPIDRYCCAEFPLYTHRVEASLAVAVILKATTVRDRSVAHACYPSTSAIRTTIFVRGATQRCIFLARLYDGLRKRQWQWLKIQGIKSRCRVTRRFALCPVFLRKLLTFSPLCIQIGSLCGLKAGFQLAVNWFTRHNSVARHKKWRINTWFLIKWHAQK